MIHVLASVALASAALALQAAPSPAPPVRLEDLTVQESAALRCSVAFAYVSDWQKDGDARGAAWPGLEAQGGREFFVRTMAQLMDRRGLDRRGVFDLIALQTERLKASPDDIPAMMPACLMMKSAAGL
ncbi:MAG: hypothetical protein NXH71_03650 [Erythrobacteraceae bacterium]|jgi:hypothetical protein|nr:hypothetical protein [Erythrobacteraceae bacterium]